MEGLTKWADQLSPAQVASLPFFPRFSLVMVLLVAMFGASAYQGIDQLFNCNRDNGCLVCSTVLTVSEPGGECAEIAETKLGAAHPVTGLSISFRNEASSIVREMEKMFDDIMVSKFDKACFHQGWTVEEMTNLLRDGLAGTAPGTTTYIPCDTDFVIEQVAKLRAQWEYIKGAMVVNDYPAACGKSRHRASPTRSVTNV